MSGALCLQGGREFSPQCEAMDRTVLERVGATRVAVLAGAARVGDDHDGAIVRALRHYARLGIEGRGIPDPRVDETAAVGELDGLDPGLDVLVLPGGSPSSLRSVLDGEIARRVIAHHERGGAISGASAGAMVMCARMARPDRGDVVDGLGLVTGLALPHWSPGSAPRWPVDDIDLWGLPECGGVLLADGDVAAVGQGAPARYVAGEWRPVARSTD
ncbi:MAG: Type 1 glutamine amidotransferase-like domain-containing protein [Ilumatobacter sp.]